MRAAEKCFRGDPAVAVAKSRATNMQRDADLGSVRGRSKKLCDAVY